MKKNIIKLVTTLVTIFSCTQLLFLDCASAASFISLGSPFALAVSGDGQTVVGGGESEAWRWTRSTGIIGLGLFPGGASFTQARAVSSDGAVVVGFADGAFGRQVFRWTKDGGMQALDIFPQTTTADIYSISADGSIVQADTSRWTARDGVITIPGAMTVYDISADGSALAGNFSSHTEALYVSRAQGVLPLGFLSGSTPQTSQTEDLSADGTTVVGYSGNFPNRAFRWNQNEGMVALGADDQFSTIAIAASVDGSVIIGNGARYNYAFLWTEETGIVGLTDALASEGLDISGWAYLEARDISYDGRTIIGFGVNGGRLDSWLAELDPISVPLPEGGGSWTLVIGLVFFIFSGKRVLPDRY